MCVYQAHVGWTSFPEPIRIVILIRVGWMCPHPWNIFSNTAPIHLRVFNVCPDEAHAFINCRPKVMHDLANSILVKTGPPICNDSEHSFFHDVLLCPSLVEGVAANSVILHTSIVSANGCCTGTHRAIEDVVEFQISEEVAEPVYWLSFCPKEGDAICS